MAMDVLFPSETTTKLHTNPANVLQNIYRNDSDGERLITELSSASWDVLTFDFDWGLLNDECAVCWSAGAIWMPPPAFVVIAGRWSFNMCRIQHGKEVVMTIALAYRRGILKT